jgi:hypothetical protein
MAGGASGLRLTASSTRRAARVRRSFSVRSETKRKRSEKFLALKRKNAVFSHVSLRSEKLEIISETKTNEAK